MGPNLSNLEKGTNMPEASVEKLRSTDIDQYSRSKVSIFFIRTKIDQNKVEYLPYSIM